MNVDIKHKCFFRLNHLPPEYTYYVFYCMCGQFWYIPKASFKKAVVREYTETEVVTKELINKIVQFGHVFGEGYKETLYRPIQTPKRPWWKRVQHSVQDWFLAIFEG